MAYITRIFILAYFITFYYSNDAELKIYAKHLKIEPNCGMHRNQKLNRISNAPDSEEVYPWAIRLERTIKIDELGIDGTKACGGSIITRQ